MNDDNKRSRALAGSVEPVAWAVMIDTAGRQYGVYDTPGEAEAIAQWLRDEDEGDWKSVPLYASKPMYRVVQLPALDPNGAPGWNAAIGAVRGALADAGVDWDTE